MPVFQINFSRPAGQIVAQYYDFLRLGREGYRRVHDAAYDTGQYLAEEIVEARPVRAALRQQPGHRHPDRDLEDHRGRRSRLHAVRPRRPAPDSGLAGAGLPADRHRVGHRRPAHPRAPGREPRPREHSARRLRATQSHTSTKHPVTVADDEGRVERLQPPLTPCTPAGMRSGGIVTTRLVDLWHWLIEWILDIFSDFLLAGTRDSHDRIER